MARVDLVIRGGDIADGKGEKPFAADVAVDQGKIVAVGRIADTGREEIDARGQLVTPGFVDIHTHYDGQATWDSRLAPSSWHGVTTAVMGNCGVGFAPVRDADHQRLIELMEGVEDIPETVLHEGLAWGWETFGEYLDALAARPHDMDIGAQLPHGALRLYVMGERGAKLEPATADDIAQMRKIAADSMRAGAIGFSSSRTAIHRTAKGAHTPSLRAAEDELTGIAQGLADANAGVIELISDFDTPNLAAEFDMIARMVRASRRPLSLSLLELYRTPNGWREILDRVDASAKNGLPIRVQVAPRPIGLLMGLQCTLSPFCTRPSLQALQNRPVAEKVAAMRDPAFRARLMSEKPQPRLSAFDVEAFERIFILGDPPNYEPPPEQSVASAARAKNIDPAAFAYDLLLENDGKAFLYAPFANYVKGNLDNCHTMIAHDRSLMGLGDAGAHVGFISDGSFPTYLLTHWGRDRAHGRFELGWLVKRLTLDNAGAVGLHDRGVIAPGMKADLNVIDMGRLRLGQPTMAFDLPAGGKRLLQRANGYAATVVSGQITYRDGEPTSALPGRLVRGAQTAP